MTLIPLMEYREQCKVPYRFGFQGQETQELGGVRTAVFELRLWDARIGRWTAPDPYGQFHSAYVGMGNDPVSLIDPDGGWAGDVVRKMQYVNLDKGIVRNWTVLVKKASDSVAAMSSTVNGVSSALKGAQASAYGTEWIARKTTEALPQVVKDAGYALMNRTPVTTKDIIGSNTWKYTNVGLGATSAVTSTVALNAHWDTQQVFKYADKAMSAAQKTASFQARAATVLNVASKAGTILGVTGVITGGYEFVNSGISQGWTDPQTLKSGVKLLVAGAALAARATPVGMVVGIGSGLLSAFW